MDSAKTLTPALSQGEREPNTWQPGEYSISTDRARLNLDLIHNYLSSESYWASGRSRQVVERSIENSLPFGIYQGHEQVGFARAISDGATFAYLADVYVLPPYRGRGLGLELVREMVGSGELARVRWMLHTADAQRLYEKFGFSENPPRYALMEREARRAGRAPSREGVGGSSLPRP